MTIREASLSQYHNELGISIHQNGTVKLKKKRNKGKAHGPNMFNVNIIAYFFFFITHRNFHPLVFYTYVHSISLLDFGYLLFVLLLPLLFIKTVSISSMSERSKTPDRCGGYKQFIITPVPSKSSIIPPVCMSSPEG